MSRWSHRAAGSVVPLAAVAALALSLPVAVAAQEPAAPDLSDPEVAHVAVTANAIDIRLAELAGTRASSDAVKRFAETMISDHTSVNERASALAEKLGVVPQDNAVSQSLEEGATTASTALEGLQGEAFDRAYMDREIEYHQAVLEALDGLLIPTSSNAELRALLEEVSPVMAGHLEHARMIRSELGGGQ